MTLKEIHARMELMRSVGIMRECPDCGTLFRVSAPRRDEFERLQLDIEIALRREAEAAK